MGLETTHNAWSGSYSAFDKFRVQIATYFNIDLVSMEGFGGNIKWGSLEYNPIFLLLNHSDSEGHIKWEDCNLLAESLDYILSIPDSTDQTDPHFKVAVKRFSDGCKLAFSKKEDMAFF